MKTEIEHFRDWESHVFGFGYGSGEKHIISALQEFFKLVGRVGSENAYDFEVLENGLTPPVAWLFINALCHNDIIEYGTSPRYGWLDHEYGVRLKNFVLSKSTEELVEIVTNCNDDYCHCTPTYCNCCDVACHNPFWKESPKRESTQ